MPLSLRKDVPPFFHQDQVMCLKFTQSAIHTAVQYILALSSWTSRFIQSADN